MKRLIKSIRSMTEIKFNPTDDFFAYPNPEIESGTIVIIIQDFNFELGKYIEPDTETPYATFEHPTNSTELKEIIIKFLTENNINYKEIEQSKVFICPEEIYDYAKWN